MLSSYLKQLTARRHLSAADMERCFGVITSGTAPDSQVGAFLTALRMKGETAAELTGAAGFLRCHASFIDCGRRDVVDIVGTGGDGIGSFNISTAAALVAAGAQVPIAKHGNRAASGKCGSADVLRELGVNMDAEISQIEYGIKEHGIGFLYAQKLHPILAGVAAVRRELKLRTVFNMVGPLCNPAGASAMVVGVYAPELTELFAEALRDLGVKRALVVHGMDGLDEISCCAPTRVSELNNREIRTGELLPELLIGECFLPEQLAGGEPALNAQILLDVVENRDHCAPRAAVLLNAAAAVYVSGMAPTLQDGIRLAEESIDSGAARRKLQILIEVSHGKSV